MKTNILVSSKEKEKKRFVIGTHNGIFHADEVVACAIFALLYENMQVEIIRSRDISYLENKVDELVDIGGGEYDHHHRAGTGGRGKRENGVPYASAGLVWKDFGKDLIYRCSCKLYGNPTDCNIITSVFEEIDEKIIQEVDKEDNGIPTDFHTFSFVSSFLPVYCSNFDDYDESFYRVLNCSINILENAIFTCISQFKAKNVISKMITNQGITNDHILKIPSQTFPWLEPIILHNKTSSSCQNWIHVYFVIFPYPAGGWAAQCVPPSLDKKFEQIVPFPKEWAGKTLDDLVTISGVEDATLCHSGCFFVRAKTEEAIISLCNKAQAIFNNENNV